MKKIKLLTTIPALAVLGTSIPIITTSCTTIGPAYYNLASVSWTKTPQVGEISVLSDFKLTKDGSSISLAQIKSCENENSSPELGVDPVNIGKIEPTTAGTWDYNVKAEIYRDGEKTITDTVSLSTKIKVIAEEPQVVTRIVNDESVTSLHVVATTASQSTDVVGKLGVKLLDQHDNEIPQIGKTISYTIKEESKPAWLTSASVAANGDISLTIVPSAIDNNSYQTTWTASCDGKTSDSISINLWCVPVLTNNGFIICSNPYTQYQTINLPTKIVRRDLSDISNVVDNKITFNDDTGQSKTVDVRDIIYLSIVNVERVDENKRIYMVYDNFCAGWTNLCYVNLSGLVDVEIVGRYAFSGCVSLLELNLTGATKIRLFYEYALSDCVSLQSIDFSSIKNDSRLIFHEGVLYNCTSLKTINISSFKENTLIHDGFAYGCTNLETVEIGSTKPATWSFIYGKDFIFANLDPTCPAYTNGITINGTNAAAFKTALPQDTTGPWTLRKYK